MRDLIAICIGPFQICIWIILDLGWGVLYNGRGGFCIRGKGYSGLIRFIRLLSSGFLDLGLQGFTVDRFQAKIRRSSTN